MKTRKTNKTMTDAQLAWCLKKGYAWQEPDDDDDGYNPRRPTYWTREGGYKWDVENQVYEMVF